MEPREIPAYIRSLWDFSDPTGSGNRFRREEANVSQPLKSVLRTQIARSLGLQKRFEEARSFIPFDPTDPLIRAYANLELGRILRSEALANKVPVPDAARSEFECAYSVAHESGFEGLATDALHMIALVATSPDEELSATLHALDYASASSDPDALRWRGSLHHNLGYIHHQAGRFEDALSAFTAAREFRYSDGSAQDIHVANWMIAWTLRAMGRLEESLAMQLELEAAMSLPDPYVFEELELLYRALGDESRAKEYATKRAGL